MTKRIAKLVTTAALSCLSLHSLGALAAATSGAAATATASAATPIKVPTKGACGFILTMSYPFVYLYGAHPGPGWGMDGLGVIDFQARTISVNIVLQNPAGAGTTESQVQLAALPFTTSPGLVPGSFIITFSLPDITFTFNLLPVSGGSSYLMQGFVPTPGNQDGSMTGTCQML